MRKKDYTEEFLTEFKSIEQVLLQIYGSGITFRDMEQRLEEKGETDISKRMYVCRVLRNYASHNVGMNDFFPIPEETVLYLKSLNQMFERERKTVKDTMSRTKPLDMKDNLIQGAKRIAKLPAVPVIDNLGSIAGIFDSETLRRCAAAEISLKTTFGKGTIPLSVITNNMCVNTKQPMNDVLDYMLKNHYEMMYVTDDGSSKGKFLGTVVK